MRARASAHKSGRECLRRVVKPVDVHGAVMRRQMRRKRENELQVRAGV